jgi:hypothetical protein
MRNTFLCLGAVTLSALSASATAQPIANSNQYNPTSAQNYGSPDRTNMSWRIAQLQTRLDAGVRDRSISHREAYPIRDSIQRLSRLERQYTANGLTAQERATLQDRIRTVRQQFRVADGGAHGRYAQWDHEDRNGWNNAAAGSIDANNDGWDDRDFNRNGRWDDDGQYAYQQPTLGAAIGGLISNVIGANSMQVGQRVPSNLYAVPYQQQGQYRDGNGVYYRSDGRQIYQIDARTHTVARIFPI